MDDIRKGVCPLCRHNEMTSTGLVSGLVSAIDPQITLFALESATMSSLQIKNHSTANRSALLLMILVSPLVGLVSYMVAMHYGMAGVPGYKLTAGVVAGWWLFVYLFMQWRRWRARSRA